MIVILLIIICFLIEVEQRESIPTFILTVLTFSQSQQLQKWTSSSRWVIFSSPCLPSFMNAVNPCSVQIPNLFLPCVSYCFYSFQLLQYTDPAQLTQLRTLDTLQFSFLAKLLCFLQITDRQLTLWYTQCSKISHFNFSGQMCSCLVCFLCNSVSRMPSTTFFSLQFPEKSWDGE